LAGLVGGIWFYRPTSRWRLFFTLAWMCAVFTIPYVLRLYFMPPAVNYDISYVLAGRVFYMLFIGLALIMGELANIWEELLKESKWRLALPGAAGAAYLYALLVLYRPADFLGMSVKMSSTQTLPPPWNPYTSNHPIGLCVLGLVGGGVLVTRLILSRRSRNIPESAG
jgi:hypothetical protein